ncbi:MAG: TonB-dependent receptor [Thermonemataceae bacterium]|nr:TonB-dependent receptor [Thermonemataceae bacterium]
MQKKYIFIVLMLLGVFFQAFSQNNLFIKGKIIHHGEPIEGAVIQIKNTSMGAVSLKDGSFELKNLEKGTYTLLITYVGHKKVEKNILLEANGVELPTVELEDDQLNLEQIVVTATRTEVSRKDAPIVCNILNDKIFNATQSLTLSEGLSFQPALRIENNCQNCGFNGLRMNGLEGAYTQMLIDGRPIYSSLQGVYGLEQIPVNMIERVEIVRSGGSALYGSSAVAGTVNIITKEPRKNQFYISTNQAWVDGSSPDQTYMLGTDVVSEDRKAGLSLYGFRRDRAFWDKNGDGFSEIGKLKANTFGLKTFYKPTEFSKLILQGYSIYEYRRGGNRFEYQPHEADIAETTTHNILNGGLTFEQYSKNYKHKIALYATAQDIRRDSYYGGGRDINAYGNSIGQNVVAGMQYSGDFEGEKLGSHTLAAGWEYNIDKLDDNAPAYERFIRQTAEQLGVYAQDNWAITPKIRALLGLRFDTHSLLENPVFSPRISLMYSPNEYLQLRAGYARGFRAPQVFDEDLHITQVGGGGTVVRNSTTLTPEYSNAYTFSIDYNKYISNDWAIGFTIDAFQTQLTDVFALEEVAIDTTGNILLERRNKETAIVRGFTINPKIAYKSIFDLQLGFTFQNSEYGTPIQWSESIENTSKKFFRTPDVYGFYALGWNVSKKLTVNLSGVYTGSMAVQHYAGDIAEDRLETTSVFLENNFKAEYTFLPKKNSSLRFSLSGGIQNFTNAYQEDFDKGENRDAAYIYGPGRPRTYFLGLKVQL